MQRAVSKHPIYFGGKRDTDDPRDVAFVPSDRPSVATVDLRPGCGAVYDQLPLQSCSAHAVAALVTYLARKDRNETIVPSRLFLYYNARTLDKTESVDGGATIRNAIKAAAASGLCFETLWPYDPAAVAQRPPDPCYEAARTLRAARYLRIEQRLEHLKACLRDGYPFAFGMNVYWNITSAETTGVLSMPSPTDSFMAGHAALAVGYDDVRQTFLVMNSLGPAWGSNGYFTIPYDYLTTPSLSFDFWTIRSIA